MKRDDNLRQKAVRLRVDQELSLKDIASELGIAKSTASLWLRNYPLNEKLVRERKVASGRKSVGRNKKPRGKKSKYAKMTNGVLNRADKARIAEAAVLFRVSLHRWEAYHSVFDGEKFDLVVYVPESDSFVRLQVRWAGKYGGGSPLIGLKRSNGRSRQKRYEDADFDFLVGYDLYTDTAYVYARKDVNHLSSVVAIKEDNAEAWWKIGV